MDLVHIKSSQDINATTPNEIYTAVSSIIEAELHIYRLVNKSNNGSGNGLVPFRCQPIIWTNAVILLIEPIATILSATWIYMTFFQENVFQNVVCTVVTIVLQPQCANKLIEEHVWRIIHTSFVLLCLLLFVPGQPYHVRARETEKKVAKSHII